MPLPLYCNSVNTKGGLDFHCDTPHRCYTDYEPSYNNRLKLGTLVLNNTHGWSIGRSALTMPWGGGYLDSAVWLECAAPDKCRELSLRIKVLAGSHIFLVGNLVEMVFYVHVNQQATLDTYTRPNNLEAWKEFTHRSSENAYVDISGVPRGEHILTIAWAPSAVGVNKAKLTHLIIH